MRTPRRGHTPSTSRTRARPAISKGSGPNAAPRSSGSTSESVHFRALSKAGLSFAATCVSCHGGHDVRPVDDPGAKVARPSIIKTCGACHAGIERDYLEGVHGKAYVKGIGDVPVCTDCHSGARHPLPLRPRVRRLRHESGRGLRPVPRRRASGPAIRPVDVAAEDLRVVLPRHGLEVRRDPRRQLLELPRAPRHPALDRSPVVHRRGQHRRDLRRPATPAPARIFQRAASTSFRRGPRTAGPTRSRSSISSSSAG